MHSLTVIVFARRPCAGRVKRRLARGIGAARAAQVYRATLARTLGEVARLKGVRRVLMPAERRDLRWFRARFGPRGWRVVAQCRGDLGARMGAALGRALGAGDPALLIGSDLADVSAADLEQARAALGAGCDAVIGPVADGGYWLIGLKRALPALFADMPWSTPEVYRRSNAVLQQAGFKTAYLPLRHDIDSARDLRHWRARRAASIQRRRACSRSNSRT